MKTLRPPMFRPRRPTSRRGYILVVTLGLLVLATTLLVAVGRLAVQHALAARLAAEQAQRRWGAVSCRNMVLPFAEQILVNAEGQRNIPVPALQVSVPLGGQVFQLIVSDEQAKANVNAILDESDLSTAQDRIRRSLSGSGLGNAIQLHLAPLREDAPVAASTTQPDATQPAQPPVRQWIGGWGQIFNGVAPERLLSSAGGVARAVNVLTCWGNGPTNVMRASEGALQLAASPPLTQLQVSRLIDARNALLDPNAGHGLLPPISMPGVPAVSTAGLDPVSRLLADAQIQVKQRARLNLTNISTCHSIWIIIQDGQRSWYEFTVLDQSNAAHPRADSFVW